jgi:hypothetical protein
MTTTSQSVATIILSQLGGNMFLRMTGAKNLVAGENMLGMKLGKGAKDGITHFTVILDADDTYTLKFQRVYGMKVTEKGELTGVYSDMLREVFTDRTGFYTSL